MVFFNGFDEYLAQFDPFEMTFRQEMEKFILKFWTFLNRISSHWIFFLYRNGACEKRCLLWNSHFKISEKIEIEIEKLQKKSR